MIRRWFISLLFSFAADSCVIGHAADVPSIETRVATEVDGANADPATATISGKVTYESDPKRPWRLGRYYLQNGKSGELAEAVVAISRRGLTGPDAASATVTVDQKNFQFTPETVVIRAGDQVKFTNSDAQLHNVQANHLRQVFNVNMQPGGEHTERFAHAGGIRQPYRIGCALHGAMRSWVFVFDHPWYQLTGRDGAFQLANVPPGEYRLEIVHPAGELRTSQMIQVKAGESLAIDVRLSPEDLPKPKP